MRMILLALVFSCSFLFSGMVIAEGIEGPQVDYSPAFASAEGLANMPEGIGADSTGCFACHAATEPERRHQASYTASSVMSYNKSSMQPSRGEGAGIIRI